ncbi:MAG: thioredoxin family protein [Methanobacteriota archaeon]|nr:MAG: thioredoxin family protein [Euryarchaeota archaeon]
MSGEGVIDVHDSDWEKAIERESKPVVVMFHSPTCPSCREVEPYFDEFAKEFEGRVAFAKLNVINNHYTVGRYGVMSTPTFKFFCKGRPVQEMVGAAYPPLLKRTIEETLEHGSECVEKSTRIDYSMTGYA